MDYQSRFVLLALFVVYASAARYWGRVDNKKGLCYVDPNHVPGDTEKVVVEGVKSPAVKLQQGSLSLLAHVSTGDDEIDGYVEDAADILKDLAASVHPAIEAGIGALGLIHTISQSGKPKEPTIEDLQKATNAAFRNLTERTNEAIDQLKDYVDNRFLEEEKELLKTEYDTLYHGWTNCEDWPGDDMERCLKNQIDNIRKEKPRFLKNLYNVRGKDAAGRNIYFWKPSVEELKEIEAGMFVFRDYEQLMLMALQTMINQEKAKKKSVTHYLKMLKEELLDARYYAYKAVEWIIKLHVKPEKERTGKEIKDVGESWACANTIECHNVEGSKPVTGTCSCKLDLALGESQRCKGDFTLFKQVSKPAGTYHEMHTVVQGSNTDMLKSAAEYWIRESHVKLKGKFFGEKFYRHYMKEPLENYWQNEILSLLPVWSEMEDKVDEELKKRRRDAMRDDMRAERISFLEYLLDQVQPRMTRESYFPYDRV